MRKIYTRTGDDGTTGIFGGERVAKDNVRVEANGNLDELNSVIGLIRTMLDKEHKWQTLLKEIQMGSPLIGRLSVNGVPLSGNFGGPPLLSRSEVYAPRFLARERKFELCRISPATRKITPLLSPQHVIGLVKIEDDTLYFYRDIYRESFSELNLITGGKLSLGSEEKILRNP